VINDDLWASISLEKPSEHIINNHFFEENIINGRFVVNSIGATAAATDIFFLENAGRSFKDSELEFSNFDYEFPSDSDIMGGFNLIKEDYKGALLQDTKMIQSEFDNFEQRFVPILQKHAGQLSLDVNNLYSGSYLESRVHQSNASQVGGFRVFMKWYPMSSLFDGSVVTKDTLVVLFYDPYHLVFPVENARPFVNVSDSSYNIHLRNKYYDYIPTELRRIIKKL